MAKTTVDTLLVKIEADMSQLKKELGKVRQATDKTSKDTKKSFSAIGLNFKTLVTGAVAVGAIQTVKSLVSVASAAEEMQGKSSVVFGEFTQDFRNFADELAQSTGRSRIELEGMGASIQDLFVPLGFSREEATGLSKTLTQLAVDVGSFNDVSDPEVMRAFQSALVGNHEAVRRFGVIISEATLKQELLRMGITKNSNEVDNATKVQARLNLLMAGTVDAQGDAVRTADSFANRSRALQSAVKDLSVDIGSALLPNLGELFNKITTDVIPAIREFAEVLGIIDRTMADEIQLVSQRIVELEVRLSKTNDKRAIRTITQDIREAKAELLDLQQNLKLKEMQEKAIAEHKKSQQKTKDEAKVKTEFDELKKELEFKVQMAKIDDENLVRFKELIKDKELLANQEEQLKNLFMEEIEILEDKKRLEDEESERIKEKNDRLTKAKNIISGVQTEEERLKQTILELREAMGEFNETELPQAEEALKRLEEELQSLDPVVKILEENFERAFDSIASAIADSMTEGKDAMESFRDVARNILNSLIRDFVNFQLQAIKTQIPNTSGGGSIFGSILGGLGGLFGGGGYSASQFQVGRSVPMSMRTGPAFGGLAGGGAISPNVPTVVGERGAELFVPNTSGRIVNNANMKGMGGGTTVINQNLNVETGVSQTVRAEMLNLLPVFKQETMIAVAESRLRGGEFASAFTGGK
jgi:hypothetical protein